SDAPAAEHLVIVPCFLFSGRHVQRCLKAYVTRQSSMTML
ncbi:MAG: CbiX/SirB N-terminal domain-containing protein, partial [Candidatus Methanofastidiosa archaeon]|nr:CbiX/SirB N-terminal domain-containing protein [Candidatus Methanofastidiosa archaeon]